MITVYSATSRWYYLYMKIDFANHSRAQRGHKASRSGQAVIEYVIMTVLLLSSAVVLSIFLYTYKQHSERVVNLVASEYP